MLRQIGFILSVFSVCLLTACDGPGVNAYHHGNDAYARGDYQTAFAHYIYAANQGVTPAQYAVGYQYFYGLGTKRDEPKGIIWFQRAARHSERAQYALHLIQEHRPPQPWTYGLKDFQDNSMRKYTSNACVINVHCEDALVH
jgi:TPR repeat protein